jgi:hypothetical protein
LELVLYRGEKEVLKNIIFIPYIKRKEKLGESGIEKPRWDSGYEYGISSWKKWAKKNNCEVLIMDEPMVPESEMLITWQRWNALEILEANKIEYDQVLIVDADSIVHPDCPNFFELTDGKFTSQLTDGCYEFVNRGINRYSERFFDKEFCLPSYEFFQTGFVIVNKKHRDFFKRVFEFYSENVESIIDSYDTIATGSDIVLMNCLRKEFGVELNILPRQFSLMDLTRKDLLYLSQADWWMEDSLRFLYNSGLVYQFTSIPKDNPLKRDRKYWMKRIYEELYPDFQD